MTRMYQTLNTLYVHAKEHMTADELDAVGDSLRGEAISMATNMSSLLEGVACLISSEDRLHEAGNMVSGSLQDADTGGGGAKPGATSIIQFRGSLPLHSPT